MSITTFLLEAINKFFSVFHLLKDKLRGGLCAVLSKRVEVNDRPVCLNAITDIDLDPLLTFIPPQKKPAQWELRM